MNKLMRSFLALSLVSLNAWATDGVSISQKKNQILIESGSQKKSHSLDLPKDFDLEIQYTLKTKAHIVVAYQFASVGDAAIKVQVIDAKTLKLLWKEHIAGLNLAKPLIYNGRLFVGMDDRTLSFDLKSGKKLWDKEGLSQKFDYYGGGALKLKGKLIQLESKLLIDPVSGKVQSYK